MTTPLRFEDLRAVLQQRVEQLPDRRKPAAIPDTVCKTPL